MKNEAMVILSEWKWYLAAAAVFIVAGVLAVVIIVAMIGISLVAAAGSDDNGNEKPSVTSEKKNNSSRKASREDVDAPEGTVAPELVGTWYTSTGGGETDFTGKSRYRSNRRQMYRIATDGSVEYTFERETLTIMQCEIKERKTAAGKAASDGETLTINFGETEVTGSNSCEGGETEEKALPAETVRLNWRFKEEFETVRLCFDEQDGETCYDRKN